MWVVLGVAAVVLLVVAGLLSLVVKLVRPKRKA